MSLTLGTHILRGSKRVIVLNWTYCPACGPPLDMGTAPATIDPQALGPTIGPVARGPMQHCAVLRRVRVAKSTTSTNRIIGRGWKERGDKRLCGCHPHAHVPYAGCAWSPAHPACTGLVKTRDFRLLTGEGYNKYPITVTSQCFGPRNSPVLLEVGLLQRAVCTVSLSGPKTPKGTEVRLLLVLSHTLQLA